MTHLAAFRIRTLELIGHSIGGLISKLPFNIGGYVYDYLNREWDEQMDESLGRTKFYTRKHICLYDEPGRLKGHVRVGIRVRQHYGVSVNEMALDEIAKDTIDRIAEKGVIAA
ncbi:hypothetical protein [Leptolyngbya sp. KIOST-1]|uniref:hypothetical protein n=1 Tax=Leptolyngbya sp. KIOST-1 TaxID=1229172 RepID=UPI0012E0398C|nr:hypothetical protein [Leptolyngbya sp. KIOST-1]